MGLKNAGRLAAIEAFEHGHLGRQDLRQLSTFLGVDAKSVTPHFDLKHLGAL